MDGKDFLKIAQTFQASEIEAERRTSIGRSYYALFNAMVQTLQAQQIQFAGDVADHALLTKYLKSSGDNIAYKIGDTLTALRKDRNNADYGMRATIGRNKSEWAYRQAADGFAYLSQINPIALAAKIRNLPQ